MLLDLVFPMRPDAARIANMTPRGFRTRYNPCTTGNFVSLASFSDPAVRAAVHEIKFKNNETGAELLGALLSCYIENEVTKPTVLIPVPLSGVRYRERGYNQVARVATCAIRTHRLITLNEHMLIRTRHTRPQTELTREARLRNVRGAFRVRSGAERQVSGAHLILLDDVATTGATIEAAKDALALHRPASVTCIALAH